MFTLGDQLYQLTPRDEATLYIDSFFRGVNQAVPATVTSATVDFPLPVDRSLFLHSFLLSGQATALSSWQRLLLELVSVTGSRFVFFDAQTTNANGLAGDYSVAASGAQVTINRMAGIVLPPQTAKLSVTGVRSDGTNSSALGIAFAGYLIPPGGLGRLS